MTADNAQPVTSPSGASAVASHGPERVIATGLGGQRITAKDIDRAEYLHFAVRHHTSAWDECIEPSCRADLVRLGIATEEDFMDGKDAYFARNTESEMPERDGIDAAADAVRQATEKLQALVGSLRDRLRPVLKENETADCIAADRLHVVRATASPLQTHLADIVEEIGNLQRQVADLIERVDIGR